MSTVEKLTHLVHNYNSALDRDVYVKFPNGFVKGVMREHVMGKDIFEINAKSLKIRFRAEDVIDVDVENRSVDVVNGAYC